jgi:hypothetical protein
MAWDANYAVIGDNPSASTFRGMNASSGGTSDKLEVYNGNSGLASLAISTAGSTLAHKPLLILRNLASTASKGTALTHFEATGELRYQVVGITTSVKSGTNALAGTFVANGATPVAVATTAWDANCVVHITLKTVGGTGPTMTPFVSSVTPGTGFSVNSVVGDTSTYNWVAMKVN